MTHNWHRLIMHLNKHVVGLQFYVTLIKSPSQCEYASNKKSFTSVGHKLTINIKLILRLYSIFLSLSIRKWSVIEKRNHIVEHKKFKYKIPIVYRDYHIVF